MKCKFAVLIGIYLAFINVGFADLDILHIRKSWCEGVAAGTHIRNVSDCTATIRCNGAAPPTTASCPIPSYLNVERQRCTAEIDANCFICQITTSTSFETVENSCNLYIRCVDGKASQLACEAGFGFNPETNRCEWEFGQTCELSRMTTTPTTVTTTRLTPPTPASTTVTTTTRLTPPTPASTTVTATTIQPIATSTIASSTTSATSPKTTSCSGWKSTVVPDTTAPTTNKTSTGRSTIHYNSTGF